MLSKYGDDNRTGGALVPASSFTVLIFITMPRWFFLRLRENVLNDAEKLRTLEIDILSRNDRVVIGRTAMFTRRYRLKESQLADSYTSIYFPCFLGLGFA